MEPRLDRTDERGGEVVLALRDTVRYHEVMNRTHQNNEIPKTVVPSPTATQNEKSEPVDSLSSSSSTAVRNTSKPKETPTVIEDPFDNFLCKSCNRGDDDAYLLICDRCDTSVKVEYGADLPTGELGIGFATVKSKDLSDQDKDYLNSPWNLNNFAYHYKS
ncbi:unnamed protein product [Didymodactylos carnosus]|uniref:Uncharacterized protein n=1 Tax=Didymodactylos carnosus TaxID=1234261 RepID=A0A813VJE6_9BILA|nr:unnamed protein product [Didymodactylos carnosus]CAF3628992.1 unnamed protein product [Didymodactylos carnosus]